MNVFQVTQTRPTSLQDVSSPSRLEILNIILITVQTNKSSSPVFFYCGLLAGAALIPVVSTSHASMCGVPVPMIILTTMPGDHTWSGGSKQGLSVGAGRAGRGTLPWG